MTIFRILIICLLTLFSTGVTGQVKIRLFSSQSPESIVFSVTDGNYELDTFNGEGITLSGGESALITKYKGRLGVKVRNLKGFVCDSLKIHGITGDDFFSLRINGKTPVRQFYAGDLTCLPDLDNLVLINTSDIEKYIAGVVRTEGGTGKNIEYFKTQAVIARTYMYKYYDKHNNDGYNLCDNTHCQAYNGLSYDSSINSAAFTTDNMVILAPDSTLAISAFHSNCGGETSSSEDVWLTSQPYLKKVVDPYCIASRNAKWEKKTGRNDWLEILKSSGYEGNGNDQLVFNFTQKSRLRDYVIPSFDIPLRTIRDKMNLRSTFFSVAEASDTIILTGRGYGHGVGLCQEGAMEMAQKGFNYKQIIDFYYTGVIISDIKNSVLKNE